MATTPTTVTDLPLRDIHLPDPISWWPPAPGWWIVASTVLFIVLVFFAGRAYYRSKALLRDANAELEKIKHQFVLTKNQAELIRDLSILLRRSCISFYPRHETASLTGDDWLKYLDATSPSVASITSTFHDGVGKILVSAPYMDESTITKIDCDALITLCETWLLAQPMNINKQTTSAN